VKPAKSMVEFLAAIFGNGTAEGGLEEVIYGVSGLGGQALAVD